jgi:hypothetical protein
MPLTSWSSIRSNDIKIIKILSRRKQTVDSSNEKFTRRKFLAAAATGLATAGAIGIPGLFPPG